MLAGVASGLAISLSACGSATAPEVADTPEAAGPDVVVVDPQAQLVAHGMLMQSAPDRPVEICVGGVAQSLPPQCGGPVLKGEFSWDEVGPERAAGVTWTNDSWWAVGTYDPDDGEQGSFTLARPVSAQPPEGYAPPRPEDVRFPQLCEHPYVDGSQAASSDLAAQERLAATLEDLDGYVTSWVSDGSSLYNVVVTSDPDAAFAELRKVWRGGLCVEQRDLPTQDQLGLAQDALSSKFTELGLLSSGAGGVSGQLEVDALITDQATVDAILETVSPWLDPDDVRITGALQPLGQD